MPITVEALIEIVRASRQELTIYNDGQQDTPEWMRCGGDRIVYIDANEFESRLTALLFTAAT